jgi:hypothetical protein
VIMITQNSGLLSTRAPNSIIPQQQLMYGAYPAQQIQKNYGRESTAFCYTYRTSTTVPITLGITTYFFD